MFSGRAGELLLILLIVLVLFGGKNLPEIMKNLGRGIRSFRREMNDIDAGSSEDECSDLKIKK